MKIEEYKPLSVKLHAKICKARLEVEMSNWKVDANGEMMEARNE